MTAVNAGDFSYKKLPLRYLTPHEIVAVALKAGEKKWKKAQEAGALRFDRECVAVYADCEIRTCLPRDLRHVQDMRGDEGWQLEVGIHPSQPKWLDRAVQILADPSADVVHLDDGA